MITGRPSRGILSQLPWLVILPRYVIKHSQKKKKQFEKSIKYISSILLVMGCCGISRLCWCSLTGLVLWRKPRARTATISNPFRYVLHHLLLLSSSSHSCPLAPARLLQDERVVEGVGLQWWWFSPQFQFSILQLPGSSSTSHGVVGPSPSPTPKSLSPPPVPFARSLAVTS